LVRVVVALAVAVVVGAAAMPVVSGGIGWLISALAALGVAVTARTVRGRLTGPPSATPSAPAAWPTTPPVAPTPAGATASSVTGPPASTAPAQSTNTPASGPSAAPAPAGTERTTAVPATGPAAPTVTATVAEPATSTATPAEGTATPGEGTATPAEGTTTPAADKPAADKPAADKPADDKPADDKPAGDKPADGTATSAADKPAESTATPAVGTPPPAGGTTPAATIPPGAGPLTPAGPGTPAPTVPAFAVAVPQFTPPTRGDRIWRWAAAAAALVLVAVPAVRASGVLAFFCLTAALALASYALVGGRTWASVLFSGFMLLPGAIEGVRWLFTYRMNRGSESGASSKSGASPKSGASMVRVIGAIAVTVFLVAVLVPLLRSADPVFANLLDSWVEHLPRLEFRSVVGAIVVVCLAIPAAYFVYCGPRGNRVRKESTGHLDGLEWLLPLGVVNLIFLVFVVVQVNVLFGGHDYVLGEGGPDYADYARGGFGQLCLVTMISLGLAAGLGGLVRRETPAQRSLIRLMGGLLCLLTLVIVASALKRMLLYVDVYGFTWLRILSFSFEVFLGLVFLLLMIAGIRLRGAWLPRATAAVGVGVLLALVAVNPEAVMARTTIDARLEHGRAVDIRFLRGLSADAVDELLRLPPADRPCALRPLRQDLYEPDPWYEFNAARQHARAVLANVPALLCEDDLPRP